MISISQLQETPQKNQQTRNSEKNLMYFSPGALFIYTPLFSTMHRPLMQAQETQIGDYSLTSSTDRITWKLNPWGFSA